MAIIDICAMFSLSIFCMVFSIQIQTYFIGVTPNFNLFKQFISKLFYILDLIVLCSKVLGDLNRWLLLVAFIHGGLSSVLGDLWVSSLLGLLCICGNEGCYPPEIIYICFCWTAKVDSHLGSSMIIGKCSLLVILSLSLEPSFCSKASFWFALEIYP